jgi:hypothetical protein
MDDAPLTNYITVSSFLSTGCDFLCLIGATSSAHQLNSTSRRSTYTLRYTGGMVVLPDVKPGTLTYREKQSYKTSHKISITCMVPTA